MTVYEKTDRFGGNGDTTHFSLGTDANGKEIKRWADLGVNDFNQTTYHNIVKVMDEIGYTYPEHYRLLEDSTSYYTLDGSIDYTLGPGVASSPVTSMPPQLAASVLKFMKKAACDAVNPKYATYTIRKYIEEVGPGEEWDKISRRSDHLSAHQRDVFHRRD